jgi:alkaline phosphatase D
MYSKTNGIKIFPLSIGKIYSWLILLILFVAVSSCAKKNQFTSDFGNTNDRIWIGKDFWSVPIEDWKIEGGKLHGRGNISQARVNLLTNVISPGAGTFEIQLEANITPEGDALGSAGLLVGVHDEENSDIRAASYFGKGIPAGVSTEGFAFLSDKRTELPENFDFSGFTVTVNGNNDRLSLKVRDKNDINSEELISNVENIHGLIAIAYNIMPGENNKTGNTTFSFDKLQVSGSKILNTPDNAFGPVLWTMHTLNRNTLKLMALLPPLGKNDSEMVNLQLKQDGNWRTVATENIELNSHTAVFTLNNWDSTKDTEYRVEFIEKNKNGSETPEYYSGTVRKDPIDRPLKFGGLTCQFYSGFPYTPLIKNLEKLNPDMLYFSGDQIYEANGGYPIKREPEDLSILSYLGKYYMFGWAFGDLMRDRPTICTPDDHDVFHGNLWGKSGEAMPADSRIGTVGGYYQSAKMVNVVNRTQCGQLPDPYDPTPVKQGISVWYTSLNYGRISFAIISDRQFKSGPESVANWAGRNDHLTEMPKNPSILDNPALKMIGERQLLFLNEWIADWDNTDMKVLLSQTVFANAATHHGSKDGSFDGYLLGDLDSGGWPKSGRDKVIKIMRKGAAFHINGDQHLPTIIQYGLDEYRDAGFSFCTPSISNIYVRWFLPDEMGYPVIDRPEHKYPNTGKYADAFGNKNYVFAVGNPGDIINDRSSRYNQSQLRVSGFGMITFDQRERSIVMDAWRFLADVENPNPMRDQFPGWPLKISQFDNFGLNAVNVLPRITVDKPNQLFQIRDEKSGETVQIFRMNGTEVQPKLHESGTFTLLIGEGEKTQKISGLTTQRNSNGQNVSVSLN